MAELKSEFDKIIISTPDEQQDESCTPNNDTTKASLSTNFTSNAPRTDGGHREYISANDTHLTKMSGESLTDSQTFSDGGVVNTDATVSSECPVFDIEQTAKEILLHMASVPSIEEICHDIEQATEDIEDDDERLTMQLIHYMATVPPTEEIVHDIEQTTEQATEETEDDIEKTTEEIVDDIYRIITGLTDSSFNDVELNGNDLIPLNMELKLMQERGLFTQKIVAVINGIVKEKYVKDINWDVYHKMMEALKTYHTIESSANDINEKVSQMKTNESVTFLIENKHVTRKVLFEFEKVDKGKADIQEKLASLKLINVPGIVETMKTLEELGLMSETLLCKLTNVGKKVAELAREIRLQRKRINDTIQAINKNVTTYKLKQVIDGNNDDGTIVVYINCRDDDSSDDYRKIRMKKAHKQSTTNTQSTAKICKSEHNIPFCEKCGWRNSWIKSFKRRGIIVKEASGAKNKDVWVNNINEN